MDIEPLVLLPMAALTAMIGTVGGLGGAVLLVPALVVLGVDPVTAAPVGLVTVAAGALAAGPSQLAHGLVHHRLGLTLEIPASGAALVAALVSVQVPDTGLRLALAATAGVAGLVGLARPAPRNLPQPEFVAEPPAEWPGTLGGTYLGPGGAIPYRARRVPLGLAAMLGAGAVSGLAGVGGGFVKTPVMRDLMYVPIKVAAATSTFTTAITAATGLLVFAGQGRVDAPLSAAAGLGGMVGGLLGARFQHRMAPANLRRILAVALLVIAAVIGATT